MKEKQEVDHEKEIEKLDKKANRLIKWYPYLAGVVFIVLFSFDFMMIGRPRTLINTILDILLLVSWTLSGYAVGRLRGSAETRIRYRKYIDGIMEVMRDMRGLIKEVKKSVDEASDEIKDLEEDMNSSKQKPTKDE